MGVRGGQLARGLVGNPGRGKRVGVELHRDRVSVIAMNRSPSLVKLTLTLSVSCGENIVITRWNSDRHGSVANSG
jgi:hypothetical protein